MTLAVKPPRDVDPATACVVKVIIAVIVAAWIALTAMGCSTTTTRAVLEQQADVADVQTRVYVKLRPPKVRPAGWRGYPAKIRLKGGPGPANTAIRQAFGGVDVRVAGIPTDGYVLTYDSTVKAWRAEAAAGGGSLTPWTENVDAGGFDLTDVGDVSAASLTGDALTVTGNALVTGDLDMDAGTITDVALLEAEQVDTATIDLLADIYVAGGAGGTLKVRINESTVHTTSSTGIAMASGKAVTNALHVVEVQRTSNQTVTSATPTLIIWQQENSDTAGVCDLGTHDTRIVTAAVESTWTLSVSVALVDVTNTSAMSLNLIHYNSSDAIVSRRPHGCALTSNGNGTNTSTFKLAAGDYLAAQVYAVDSDGTVSLENDNTAGTMDVSACAVRVR